ncbi:response regulator [Usitatibacter palustris]|uniref:Transcriptional regulatory protein DegU n=1 Tax=Usitatibacter palustris TaxID=2732487 RepID=A0A6M4H768_9PROT|nr:response regulator transcription factor [Usitatibacter palustris]QJR15481.1 Transcriptional regulatory protein DegU [Usitatibacter palustris]
MSALRILLCDDHGLVRAGIRALVEDIPGVSVVAEADNGRQAVALAAEHRPNIVIMDIVMRELNGIDATAQILAANSDIRVLILSMHTTDDFVLRALRAGASGYLVKESLPVELQLAVEAIARGETYLSPRVSKVVVSGLREGATAREPSELDALSPRQREVLQLMAEGKSTKEIAFDLSLSVKTVENHRAALMERLGIHDVAGLVVFAVRHGLIEVRGPDG